MISCLKDRTDFERFSSLVTNKRVAANHVPGHRVHFSTSQVIDIHFQLPAQSTCSGFEITR